jgi:outer membrane protein assembly factor BamB
MGDRRNDFADYYSSSPIIYNGIIYFGSGESIYAINHLDGKLIWNYKTGDVVHTRPAINNDKLFIGSFDGTLYALNTITGNLYWKFKTIGHRFFPKGEAMGNPVIGKNLVYFGARDYNFYAVDINGGYCHWMKQFPKGWALPAAINDSLVLLGTSDDRLLFAYDRSTGNEIWRLNAGFNIFGEIANVKKTGCFGTLAGKVIGFDLKTGTILWELKLDGYNTNHLKYLKPDDSYVDDISNLIRSSQDILKMYFNLGGVFSKPAISDDNMIITCYDGSIYCFKQ